jgi:hypothetical protein
MMVMMLVRRGQHTSVRLVARRSGAYHSLRHALLHNLLIHVIDLAMVGK